MKAIDPGYEILTDISHACFLKEMLPGVLELLYDEDRQGSDELKLIERAARICYKSEDKVSKDSSSARRLVKHLIDRGHEAMLEHSLLTVKFTCSRAVSHELVRHRVASFAQESQRYCNYSKEGFGGEIMFVKPLWLFSADGMANDATTHWYDFCLEAEKRYFDLLDWGLTPQEAREVLPNSTKTEVVISANYREWRHILKLRTASDAHPEMQRLMRPLLEELKTKIPVIFDDIG